MKKNSVWQQMMLLCLSMLISTSMSADDENGLTVSYSTGFPIVAEGVACNIVVDPNEKEVIGIVAEAFCGDVELLTNVRPTKSESISDGNNIIVGTLGTSTAIDQLVTDGKISTTGISGQWETFCITTVEVAGKQTLVVYGSDPRGTAFGLFEVSRAMGVTPYVWWADVTPEHHDNVYMQTNGTVVGPPSVKYRGMFINDEDWGLQPWAAKNMDKDLGDIGPRTYEHVFELLLRLKANYLWPAMHPCTKAFWYYKENPVVARRYSIVLGASHCEPLLRNNVDEWTNNYYSEYGTAPGEWNWKTNSEAIKTYWTDRVIESKDNDALYTIGMRGIHDSSMPGYNTNEEKQAALKDVIATQRDILSTNLGKEASDVPQLFCPYKEALTLYRMGLDLPEDVTLLWADDNFGYVRQYSNPDEQLRSGGGGVYYHFSYWGVPYDHLWLSSVSPTLTSYELKKAYDLNCKDVWVFNIGDIKPQEAEFQFAMDFAWDVERWSPEKAYSYTEVWAEEYFGASLASDIAAVKNEYYRLAASGKPEHVHVINYTRAEVEQRLADYIQLEQDVEAIKGSVPSRLSDAFYQLVYYPICAACNMNKKVLYAKMSYYAAEDGNQPLIAEYGNKAYASYERIVNMTKEYNTGISDGKWNGIMDYAPRALSYFYEPTVQSASNVNMTPVAADNSTETIKLSAGKYTASGNSSDWKMIEGLGISDSTVTVLPLNLTAYTSSDITSAPYVEYDIPVGKGTNNITVKCLPTFPIYSEYKLRFATSIAGSTPEFHDITLEAETSPWSTYVMTGYSLGTTTYDSESEGTVKLRIYAADPGVAISEVEVKKPAAETANENLTSKLTNPSFEYKSEGVANNGAVTRGDPWGWSRIGSLNGNSYGISSDATGYEGTSICWYNSTPMPSFFEMYQIITGLEAGTYLVRCKLGVFSGTQTNQRLFANNSVQFYGKESDYVSNQVEGEEKTFAGHAWGVKGGSKGQLYEMAVYVTITEGDSLKVGIRSSNLKSDGTAATDNSGWFKCDDFRVEKVASTDNPQVILFDDTYTGKIVNPSFELLSETTSYSSGTTRGDPYGWTHTGTLGGNSWGVNNDGTGIEGNALCWYNAGSGTFPSAFQLSQIIDEADLPAGHYQLTAKVACYTDKLTNQRLFANKYTSYYGYESDYMLNLTEEEHATWAENTPTSSNLIKPICLDFWLFDGEDLTLGIKSSNIFSDGTKATGNNNAGWFKIDDFRLTLVSSETQDFVDHLDALAQEASELTSAQMSTTAKTELNTAITNRNNIGSTTDMTEIKTSVNELIDAIAKARLSANTYSIVSQAVSDADNRVSLLDASYDDTSYEGVISPIRAALTEGTLEANADYVTNIKDAVSAAIKSQTNDGADMTDVISNSESFTGWTTTSGDKWQVNTWSTEGSSDGTNMRTPFIEDWVAGSSSQPLKNSSIQSTVSGLHKGKYRISVLIRAYREYDGSGDIQGFELFANEDKADMKVGTSCAYNTKTGVYGTYEVETVLEDDGSITFGVSVEDATFNWLAMKNFTLTYIAEEETAINEVENKETRLTNSNGNIYNLHGQKLKSPQKGINIINGQKYFMK